MLFADETDRWIAFGSMAVTVVGGGLFGLLTILVKGRIDLTTAMLRRDVADLTKKEAECQKRTSHLESEMAKMKARGAASVTGFYLWAKLNDELILDASDGVQDVSGYRPAELVGKPLSVLMPADVSERHHQGVRSAVEKGVTRSKDYAIRSRLKTRVGGEVAVIITISPAPERGPDVYRAEVNLSGAIVA